MIKVTCDKCNKVQPRDTTVRAYADKKKTFVRLCYLCTDDLRGYHLTFDSRRKLGENLPRGIRA